MRRLLALIASIYDPIERYWESEKNHKILGTIIVFSFLGTLGVIQLNIMGWLPSYFSPYISINHFAAIEVAFVVLLAFEVMSLVFTLPGSHAKSLQKQFEIIALILLRNAFKEFSNFAEPIDWANSYETLMHIGSDSLSALIVFLGIFLIRKARVHTDIIKNTTDKENFLIIKKVISVALMVIFIYLAIQDAYLFSTHAHTFKFFQAFYNTLIFTDILMVLVSLRYNYRFRVLFRNSGFALATVLLRMALSAPVYINGIIAISSVIFVYALTLIYQQMSKRDL